MLKPFKWMIALSLLSVVLVGCGDEEQEPEDADVEEAEEETSEEAPVFEGNEEDEDAADELSSLDHVEEATVVLEGEDSINIDLRLALTEEEVTEEIVAELEEEVTTIIDGRPIDLIIIADETQVHGTLIED